MLLAAQFWYTHSEPSATAVTVRPKFYSLVSGASFGGVRISYRHIRVGVKCGAEYDNHFPLTAVWGGGYICGV